MAEAFASLSKPAASSAHRVANNCGLASTTTTLSEARCAAALAGGNVRSAAPAIRAGTSLQARMRTEYLLPRIGTFELFTKCPRPTGSRKGRARQHGHNFNLQGCSERVKKCEEARRAGCAKFLRVRGASRTNPLHGFR